MRPDGSDQSCLYPGLVLHHLVLGDYDVRFFVRVAVSGDDDDARVFVGVAVSGDDDDDDDDSVLFSVAVKDGVSGVLVVV